MNLLLGLLLLATAPASAAPEEAKGASREPGSLEPWQNVDEIRPGDRWMKIRMDVDKKGRPLKCRVLSSNIRSSEQRFWMCNAMMSQWQVRPVMKDGVPIATSVERMMIMPGRATSEEWRKAKKQLKPTN